MWIDRHFTVTYREDAVNQILKNCGLEDTTVLFKGKNHICSLYNVKNDSLEIGLERFKETIKSKDEITFVICIRGKRFSIRASVTSLKIEGGKVICDIHIISTLPLELRTHFEDMMDALEVINARKYDRIYCNEETLKNFNIEPRFRILFPEKEYICYIKNISIDGISFVTTADFMNETSEKYILAINFNEPSENLHIAGKIVRRVENETGGIKIVECGMKLEDNIYLNKRIMEYLKKYSILKSKIKRQL